MNELMLVRKRYTLIHVGTCSKKNVYCLRQSTLLALKRICFYLHARLNEIRCMNRANGGCELRKN